MSTVYFIPIASYDNTKLISASARKLLERVIQDNQIKLAKKIPLKVHFGENGNTTYIMPHNFQGIFDYLIENNIESSFIETNAVYSGKRKRKDDHILLAHKHGFTSFPVEIADGDRGHEYNEIESNKKYFKLCKIAKGFEKYKQFIVLSHFKGHRLAGFGGALKQLAMGFASRGGKLEQHADSKPMIMLFSCKKCRACVKYCPVNAIHIGAIPHIKKKVCIGCASCIAVCPHGAILFNIFKLNLSKKFRAKMAEYAYAAQNGKTNIYISFAFNITKHCDCEGHRMEKVAHDFGILASTDPVAIDSACMDIVDKRENRKVFKGREILDYAEKYGIGSKSYSLKEI
jgi:uncharacterized Fe-S center protein